MSREEKQLLNDMIRENLKEIEELKERKAQIQERLDYLIINIEELQDRMLESETK